YLRRNGVDSTRAEQGRSIPFGEAELEAIHRPEAGQSVAQRAIAFDLLLERPNSRLDGILAGVRGRRWRLVAKGVVEAPPPRPILGISPVAMEHRAAAAAKAGMDLIQSRGHAPSGPRRRDQDDVLARGPGAAGGTQAVAGHARGLVVDR